jgi:hypothetical protein
VRLAILFVAACGSAPPPPFSGIDCGSSREGTGPDYDAGARECVWKAYPSGAAVRWNVMSYTIEGDPIPQTLRFDSVLGVVTTRDMSADKFSSSTDRRIWMWRCTTMAKVVWVTDPSRYSFKLSNCTGAGATTVFP